MGNCVRRETGLEIEDEEEEKVNVNELRRKIVKF